MNVAQGMWAKADTGRLSRDFEGATRSEASEAETVEGEEGGVVPGVARLPCGVTGIRRRAFQLPFSPRAAVCSPSFRGHQPSCTRDVRDVASKYKKADKYYSMQHV